MSRWTDIRDKFTDNVSRAFTNPLGYQAGLLMNTLGNVFGNDTLKEYGNRVENYLDAYSLKGLIRPDKFDDPDFPTSVNYEAGSPTYSLTSNGNRKRVGEPIPVIYGRMRVYPDLIETPSVKFDDAVVGTSDAMYYYQTMCIGHGTFTLENGTGEPRLGDVEFPSTATLAVRTNRGSIPGIGYDSRPQNLVTQFPEITGQTITTAASAAQSYLPVRWGSGDIGMEIDVVFPGGLFDATSGTLANRSVQLTVTAAEYNGVTLVNSNTTTVTVTAAQRGPFRRTIFCPISWIPTVGRRYLVSISRAAAESTSLSIVERCVASGGKLIRAGYSTTSSGTTVCGIRLIASESINGDIASKFSILVTRQLPVWNGSTWSAPTATRSISWALADILRNTTYGAGLPDDQIDLAQLLALDGIWSARGDYCDCVFDQSVTVWEALERVARCGRAKPIIRNGQVTFVRDEAKTTIVAAFTPSHIKPKSLSINYSTAQEDDPDGIELAYVDPSTWTQTKLTYKVGGGTPTRPRSVNFFGCTNSAQALREATYLARKDKYQRKAVQFTTEMDGHLVSVGDLIVVAHDLPGWGQSGEVIGFVDNGATCDYLTSQTIDWSAVGTKYVLLRKPDGTVTGPHTATQITGGFRIDDPGWTPATDLSAGDRTAYLFGTSGAEGARLVVTGVVPRGTTSVQITAVPYDARIHDTGA